MGTPLPAVAGTYKARFIQRLGDDANVENIMYVDAPDALFPFTPAECVTQANELVTLWASRFSPLLTTDHHLTAVQVIDLSTVTGSEGTSTGGDTPGTALPPTAPAASCMVTTLQTASRGRSFRGRQFMSGIPRSQIVDPQHWDPSEVLGWQTAWTNFINDLGAVAAPHGPLNLVVTSYFSGKDPNPNPLSRNRFIPRRRITPLTTDVTTIKANSRIGSQRRRSQ